MIAERFIASVLPIRAAPQAAGVTVAATNDEAWTLYLVRPERAYALAQTRILRDAPTAQGGQGEQSSALGWAFLTRAFAQCRLIGQTPEPKKITADFGVGTDFARVATLRAASRSTPALPQRFLR